jgi:hypothetical protein
MSLTDTKKRLEGESRIGDLTLSEFRTLMNALIDERLSAWIDPDAGMELHPEIIERIKRQRAEYAAGKRGKSLEELAGKYGVKL